MALPAIHRADHSPMFISPQDTCWDMDRLRDEEAAIADPERTSPWKEIGEHPMTRYWSGESRGDLSTVKEYLLPDQTPTVFKLRRLPLNHWATVEQLRERGLLVEARIALVRFGVSGIDGGPDGVDVSQPMGAEQVQTIKDLLGDVGFNMLAHVIHGCSKSVVGQESFS